MKLARKRQRLNSRMLQICRQRMHFTAYVGQMRLRDLWCDDASALDAQFEAAQMCSRDS
jgi:hypothetical protein